MEGGGLFVFFFNIVWVISRFRDVPPNVHICIHTDLHTTNKIYNALRFFRVFYEQDQVFTPRGLTYKTKNTQIDTSMQDRFN